MFGLNCLISSVSDSACYYLATIVDDDHNIDLGGGCARDSVLFLMVAMEDKEYM